MPKKSDDNKKLDDLLKKAGATAARAGAERVGENAADCVMDALFN